MELIFTIPSFSASAFDMRELPSLQPPTLPSKRYILERLGHLKLDPKSILPGVAGKRSNLTNTAAYTAPRELMIDYTT